jgi:hypothetical protein
VKSITMSIESREQIKVASTTVNRGGVAVTITVALPKRLCSPRSSFLRWELSSWLEGPATRLMNAVFKKVWVDEPHSSV